MGWTPSMVTVKRLHCDQRPTIMIYIHNMITWKRTFAVCRNPKEWSHSSMVRNYINILKYNNQQRWRQNDAIVIVEKNDDRQRKEERVEVRFLCYLRCHWRRRCQCRGRFQKQNSIGGGGVYGDSIIAQKISLGVISNPREWSHSWEMSKPIKTTKK